MIEKKLILPDRVRKIPAGFGWTDRRFLHDGHLASLDSPAILLYYFLTTVGDVQGLSFWADPRVSTLLKLPLGQVVGSRDRLVEHDLIAFRHPIYQVLSLPEVRA